MKEEEVKEDEMDSKEGSESDKKSFLEPEAETFMKWLTIQDINHKRAMRLLNHIESKNYLFSPVKGRKDPRINPLLQQSRGQGSQYGQVLYIMKNYLATTSEEKS